MTTVNPPTLKWYAGELLRSGAYPSAVLSGIAPDRDHLDNGGYHVSIDDLIRYGNAGDYSNRNPLDKAPPVTAAGRKNACAVDISMSTADMKRHHARVRAVWLNRDTDTRAKYVNAINTWDGSGDAIRYNFVKGTSERASSDHQWHEHEEWPRAYADDVRDETAAWRAARAHLSIAVGQSHDGWLRQEKLGPYAPKPGPPKPAPTPTTPPAPPAYTEDDTMIIETRELALLYAYDSAGKLLSSADPEGVGGGEIGLTILSLPPAGHPEHRWAKTRKLYLSLAGDHLGADGARIRVAINDGKIWHVKTYTVTDKGGRLSVTVPPPATQSAYVISLGRCAPTPDTDPDALPDGIVTVLAEILETA